MSKTKILVSGLPATGKTTYIAALWNYVRSDAPDKLLTRGSLEGVEHEYLNSIADDWLGFEIPKRSLQNAHHEKVILPLKKVSDSSTIDLEIPDMAGERFRDHFDLREWSHEFDGLIEDIDGVLTFVNPHDVNNQPKFIAGAVEFEDLLGDNGENRATASENAVNSDPDTVKAAIKPTPINWDVKFVPNQVKIVESLQFLQHHKSMKLPVRLSIIISAWDAVSGSEKLNPEKWLENNLPLLYQYLCCNSDKYAVRYFGVSAQGCDYEKKEQIEALENLPFHSRIKVKQGDDSSMDITTPIIWMTEER